MAGAPRSSVKPVASSEEEGDLSQDDKIAKYGWHFDMLHHTDRNSRFGKAISRVVERHAFGDWAVRIMPGKHVRVLDIGAGSGLLSLMVLDKTDRCRINSSVTAVEVDRKLADIARLNIHAHLSKRSKRQRSVPHKKRKATPALDAKVVSEHSTKLTSRDLAGGERADMLVAEILDSGLLGEDVLPTVRHAAQHLLKPGYSAVPNNARVFGQVVQGEIFRHWCSVDTKALSHHGLNVDPVRWRCSNGDAHPFDCHVHSFVGDGRSVVPLTDPFFVFDFDFCDPSSFPPEGRSQMCRSTRGSPGVVYANRDGIAHAVVFWWECTLASEWEDAGPIMLSTRPAYLDSELEAPGNYHWKQAVSVLPQEEVRLVKRGEILVLHAHHSDEDIWFNLDSNQDAVQLTSDIRPAPQLPKASEDDLWHSMFSHNRFWQLNSCHRGEIMVNTVRQAMHLARAKKSATSNTSVRETCLFCLDISDGSLLTFIGRHFAQEGRDVFVSFENSKASKRLWNELLQTYRSEGTHLDMHLILGNLPGRLVKKLRRLRSGKNDDDSNEGDDEDDEDAEAEEQEESEDEEGDEEEEETDEGNEEPLFDLVLCEPYFAAAEHQWGEAALFLTWFQIHALSSQGLLRFGDPSSRRRDAVTAACPCMGRIYAMAVSCPTLWKNRQPLNSSSLGLESDFDIDVGAINVLAPASGDSGEILSDCQSVAMMKNDYIPLSEPFVLLEVDLTKPMEFLMTTKTQKLVPPDESEANPNSIDLHVHALVLWVDFVMLRATHEAPEVVWSTAPPAQQPTHSLQHAYERVNACYLQGVRFASAPQGPVRRGEQSFVYASAAIDPDGEGHVGAGFQVCVSGAASKKRTGMTLTDSTQARAKKVRKKTKAKPKAKPMLKAQPKAKGKAKAKDEEKGKSKRKGKAQAMGKAKSKVKRR